MLGYSIFHPGVSEKGTAYFSAKGQWSGAIEPRQAFVVHWRRYIHHAREARQVRVILPIKVIIAVSAAIAITIGSAGCGSGAFGQAATLLGIVVHDSDKSPLEGVQVTDNKVTANTDATGAFQLDIENDGNATLYVLADGYEVAQVAIPAGGGVIDLGQFSIKPAPVDGYGNITGIIADAGSPVEGAQVWVGGNIAVTDADGVYNLYNVAEGRRDITASTGAKYGTASVQVISLRTVTVNIAVTSGPPVSPY